MKFWRYIIFALILVLLDQGLKLWVHSNMALHETIHVAGDWFKLHYILNPGIAFGMTPNFAYGKLILSVVRLLAVVGLGWYTWYLFKKGAHKRAGLHACAHLGRSHRKYDRFSVLRCAN